MIFLSMSFKVLNLLQGLLISIIIIQEGMQYFLDMIFISIRMGFVVSVYVSNPKLMELIILVLYLGLYLTGTRE